MDLRKATKSGNPSWMPRSSPGMTLNLRRRRRSNLRQAALKPLADFVFRQIAADEDDAADALLAPLPGTLMVAIQDHVHALKHKTLGIVLERQDALRAQDVQTFGGDQVLHPREELVGVERLLAFQRKRLHLLVVIVLEAIAMMVVMALVMIVMMMVVMVVIVMIVIVGRQK